jgi:hypothetical protein
VEANSTGGQGSRRALAPSNDDDAIRKFTVTIPSANQNVTRRNRLGVNYKIRLNLN